MFTSKLLWLNYTFQSLVGPIAQHNVSAKIRSAILLFSQLKYCREVLTDVQ